MHFFIDHAELSTLQSNDDGFGPAPTDPSNVYNATSRFQLANPAKAFACESGMMVVQQSVVDPGLVNLIIKPDANLNALADVQYYVYRGVLKDSLITTSGVLQHTGADNELLKRIWAAVPPPDTDIGTLGYDSNTILDTELLESIFDNSRAAIKPIHVNEGEWIGTFGKSVKIGFEIVLAGRFSADLKYVRAERHQIIATGLAGMDLRTKREEILNFIDPAAFFGLHIDQKVKYSTYNPAKVVNKTSPTAGNAAFIYTLLLTAFITKNRLYLDIRSEKGYSYNFYQNYADAGTGHNIDIAYQAVAGVTQPFATSDWPIFYTDASQTTASASNNLKIKLRIDDNTTPILFIKNRFFKEKNNKTSYIKEDEISIQGAVTLTTWSKRVQFNFRNTGAGASRPNIANYIKLNYFRQVHNAAHPSVLLNQRYYDSAFCSIDLPRLGDATATFKQAKSAEPVYVREPNNTDGTGNFGLNMANGAYWDTNRVLFYAMLQYENTARTSQKEFIHTYGQKLDLVNDGYKASSVYRNTEILCRSYVTNTGTIRIPSINHFAGRSMGATKNHKENAILLGLSVAEVASIKADTQLDHLHHRFIHLEPLATNPQADTTAHRYFSYTVQLQGMLGNANPIRVTPIHAGNPIVVHSRDNQFFSSELFSVAEAITAGQNRIEFHIFQDGCVKITDNKDLALVHDVERIYYMYFSNTNVVTPVCDLDLVMADAVKRIKNGTSVTWPAIPPIPAGYNLTVDYAALAVPNVDAEQSYANVDGDILTAGTMGVRKYPNQKKKVFMVHFEEALVENVALAIDFTYVNTLRLYANPSLAAATIGALVELTYPIICQGFAFADSSCYPSAEHVNGLALDTNYNFTLANDVAFNVALNRFGFKLHRIGNSPHYLQTLHDHPSTRNWVIDAPLHNSHLHSTNVVLNDCNRTL